jgi:hypothetical protein
MGGLAFSAAVSLLIVPMFYVWFDELNLWRRRVFGAAGQQDAMTPPAEPVHTDPAPAR